MDDKTSDSLPEYNAARSLQTYFLRGRVNLPIGRVAVFRHNDIEVMFNVVNDHDVVQRSHNKCGFYERDDLGVIERYFPTNGVFVDIGANVGNHTVFAAVILGASKVIPFEPNPVAQEIFISNAVLNRIMDQIDFSFFTYGLSNKRDDGLAIRWNPNNLGGGRIVRSDAAVGDIAIIRGDDALRDRQVDFLKIDVEGLELEVLEGLSATIEAQRPRIFIEIDDRNADRFFEWLEANDYVVAERIRNYVVNENFLILPQEKQ